MRRYRNNCQDLIKALVFIVFLPLILIVKILQAIGNRIDRGGSSDSIGEAGERRVDRVINSSSVKKVSHRQINNVTILDENGYSHQIDHVEIRENGVFCIETKNYKGWIFGQENQEMWTQSLYNGEKYQFRNPLKQNNSHVYHLNKALKGKYKIFSVVVFAQNNADKIDIPNVINLCDLKDYLANFHSGVRYSEFEMDMIQAQVMMANKRLTSEEHLENIKKQQQDLDNNICPRCKSKLVFKEGKYGPFWGCSSYPQCKFTKKIDTY